MARAKRTSRRGQGQKPPARPRPVGLRIVGGTFRGRKLQYAPDRRVRPMKNRVREAIFNLLGPSVRDKQALDLFAGTGAIALEAISRGAAGATFVECHYPTARVLEANVAALGVQSVCRIVVADAFAWIQQGPCLAAAPWVVFVAPPYDFFVSRTDDMLQLIHALYAMVPAESTLVVESDQRFDVRQWAGTGRWDVRDYPPARVALSQKT